MWIMPDYYLAAATQCLFTLGANTDGTALLDIHHSKNNVSSLSRKEFSIQARATRADEGFFRRVQYTLEDTAMTSPTRIRRIFWRQAIGVPQIMVTSEAADIPRIS